jgi:hypothetical protein
MIDIVIRPPCRLSPGLAGFLERNEGNSKGHHSFLLSQSDGEILVIQLLMNKNHVKYYIPFEFDQ